MPRKFFVLMPLLLLALNGWGQRCGLTDTVDISQFGRTEMTVPIAGYLNDNLAASNQSLCGVTLYFSHSYVYGLTLELVSPAGDTVELVGPTTDQSRPPTSLARWFVEFRRCSEPAAPDPGAPLRWSNTDPFNWPAFGTFTGAYYPSGGCLSNFNEGSLNGDWRLLITNDRDGQRGELTQLRLTFCDDRHADGPCCLANAGEFTDLQPLTTCAEPTDLPVELSPRYRQPRPPAAEYGYTYAVFQDDTLRATTTTPNLAGYGPGDYEICGLSYRLGELTNIPLDGSQTRVSLLENLQGANPLACADLTLECQRVTLAPKPDTTFINRAQCRGGFTQVGPFTYSTPGEFTTVLPGQYDCDSVVVLNLEVVDTFFVSIDTTICAGAAYVLGDNALTASGNFRDTLTSFFGCDSIVTVNLQVAEPIVSSFEVALCPGESFQIGSASYTETGLYSRSIPAANGCDSTVTLDLLSLDPQFTYVPYRPQLDCRADTVLLDGSPTKLVVGAEVNWLNATGEILAAGPRLTVREAGSYILSVRQSARGIDCTAFDTIFIRDERQALVADFSPVLPGPGALPPVPCTEEGRACGVITCRHPVVGVRSNVNPSRPGDAFVWATPPEGMIVGPADSSLLFVSEPGRYALSVLSPATGCRLDTVVTFTRDTEGPSPTIFGDSLLTCTTNTLNLSADTEQRRVEELSFRWDSDCAGEPSFGSSTTASCGGTYRLFVTNEINGCQTEESIHVGVDTVAVRLNLAPAAAPVSCFEPERILSGGNFTANNDVRYAWARIGSPAILSTDQRLTARRGGTYALTITDQINGCFAVDSIVVPADTVIPVAEAGPATLTLNCYAGTAVLGGVATALGADIQYNWASASSGLATVSTDRFLPVTPPADIYILTTLDTGNGCSDSDTIRVATDFERPLIDLLQPLDFDCFMDAVLLDASNTFINFPARQRWSGPCLDPNANQSTTEVFCPGSYTYAVTNLENGCTSSATQEVLLADNSVVAVAPDTVWLDCASGAATIDASNSTFAASIEWRREGRLTTLRGYRPEVRIPGRYQLIIGNFNGSCRDTAEVIVASSCPLLPILLPPDSITCSRPFVLLDATFSQPAAPESSVTRWLIPPDVVTQSTDDERTLRVFSPGRVGFEIRNTITGGVDTAYVTVIRNQVRPDADAGPRDTIDCYQPSFTLDAGRSSQGPLFDYVWTTSSGDTVGIDQRVAVTTPGTYLLIVTQRETGCARLDNVTLIDDRATPEVSVSSPGFPCDGERVAIVATASNGPEFSYAWTGPAILAGNERDTLVVARAGGYSVRVTRLDNGCSLTQPYEVVQLPCPPFPSLADTALTCTAETVVLRPSFRDGCRSCAFRWRRNGVAVDGARDSTLSVDRPGTYEVIATNEFGLVDSTLASVSDARLLPSGFAGAARTITCREPSVFIGAGLGDEADAFAISWRGPTGDVIDGATSDRLGVDAPGRYEIEIRDRFSGCVASEHVSVAIDTIHPNADAGPPRTLTCDAKRRVLDGTDSDFGRRLAYTWASDLGPACIEGQATLNPIVRCAGTYTLTVRDTANGCFTTSTTEVERDDALPGIAPLADTVLNCSARAIELQGGVLGPDFISSAWARVENEVAEVISPIMPGAIAVTEAGLYRFTLTNTRSGCTNGFDVNVSADLAEPVVEAGKPDTFNCGLDSLLLQAEILENAEPTLRYEWSSMTGFAIARSQSLTPAVYQPDTYFVRVYNPRNQCAGLDSVRIARDNDAPLVNAGADATITCALTQVQLNGGFEAQSGQGVVRWTTVDGQDPGIARVLNPSVTTPGRYQLNVTDPENGCAGADVVLVLADTLAPTVEVLSSNGTLINCIQPSVDLEAAYAASGSDASLNWLLEGLPIGRNRRQTILRGGRVRLEVIDPANGCVDSAVVAIREDLAKPVASVEAIPTLNCLRETSILRVASPSAGQAYSWVDPRDSLIAAGPATQVNQPGRYGLVARLRRNGCSDTIPAVVQLDRRIPTVRFIPPDPLDCDRQTTILDAGGSDRGERFVPTWVPAGAGGRVTENPYRYLARSSGTFRLLITDVENGCRGSESVEVIREAEPIDSFDLDIFNPLCPEDPNGEVLITGVTGGSGPYRYRINDGLLTDRLSYDELPVGNYTLEVVGQDGCTAVREFDIDRPAPATLTARSDTLIKLGDSIRLSFTTDLPDYGISWRAGGAVLDTGQDEAPIVRPFEATRYRLQLSSPQGCVLEDDVLVEVEDAVDVFVPNAFSPNSDGTNDRLRPFTGPQVDRVERFTIYNRWGARLYDSLQDPDANGSDWGWDGTHRGRAVTSQQLVWKLEVRLVDGRVKILEGGVALLR